ncbi:Retrovirus-related Pol polyprotein from transposon 17.6 [Anthophora retusa]
MIDTGAEPNIIKVDALKPSTVIYADESVNISGITHERIQTLGTTNISIYGTTVKFHVMPRDFAIPTQGLLGSTFFREGAEISYAKSKLSWKGHDIPFASSEACTVQARTAAFIEIKATGPAVGYLPKQEVAPYVTVYDSLVRNRDGRTFVKCVNASDEAATFPVPIVNLEEFDMVSDKPRSGTYAQVCAINRDCKTPQRRREEILEILCTDHLNSEEQENLAELVDRHHDLFHLPGDYLGMTSAVAHKIPTTDDIPTHVKQYRYPPIHKAEINLQMKELLDNDIVAPSKSPYNSPLWIVPKKPDEQGNKRWRMVIDYRALNEKSIPDAYPLPSIVEILDQLGSAKYFSVFDLASGFHQIGLAKEDAQKTAFSTPYGHYEFRRMPFGLRNAPATFQRLMDSVLSGLQGTELFVYLDDIVIYSRSLSEHRDKFNKLADRLRRANLKLQPSKCGFLHREVAYLGHVIGENGVKPCPKKIESVQNYPRPKNAKNVREFLGLAGYYRRFINKFSHISKPLTALLKKENKFTWGSEQENAFSTLRNALCHEPVLQYPNFDEPFHITTDASGHAVGAILSQGEIGSDRPIAYTSRLLQGPELNYSTIEKECLAIIYAVNHFRPYVYGRAFNLITDHRPLIWMNSVKDPSSRLLRWRLKLAEYEYKLIYKAGKKNVNADALSRNPVPVLPLTSDSSDGQLFIPSSSRSSKPRGTTTQSSTPTPAPRRSPPIPSPRRLTHSPTPRLTSPSTSHDFPALDSRSTSPTTAANLPTTDTDETYSPPLFDAGNVAAHDRRQFLTHIRDRVIMRKDNVACFVSLDGQPAEAGAVDLAQARRLKPLRDATIGRAKVEQASKFALIQLPVKESALHSATPEDVAECLRSLYNVAMELRLPTISISRTNLDNVSWEFIRRALLELFISSNTKIIVCTNEVQIPPKDLHPEIIIENHVAAYGGHKGISKTYRRIREKYYWPTLKQDVQRYVNTCASCQTKKLTRVKTRLPMTLTDTPGRAFDKVSLDIMGPLPPTPSGFQYILTMQDLLTKYSLAAPLRSTSAIDTADAFVKSLICRFGAPKAILTDQGANFTSSLMRTVARKFRVAQFKTTAFHPQSNGSIERSHLVLTEYLKHYVRNNDWDEWLDLAMFSYNTSVHGGTHFTPHELVFGHLARAPTSDTAQTTLNDESYSSYFQSLNQKLVDVQSKARENLNKAKERSKHYYDRRVHEQAFAVDDFVYLLKEPTKGKFDDQYTGPYRVIQVVSKDNVKIKLNNRVKIVHVNKLKLAKQSSSTPTPPSVHTTRTSEIRSSYLTASEAQNAQSSTNIRSSNTRSSSKKMHTLAIFCTVVAQASALIGYDCGSRTLNVSTFSTVDTLDCSMEDLQPTTQKKPIQLIQIAEFNSAPVVQCKVEIDRTIYYCGMHSHTSVVNNGRQQYILSTSKGTCTALQNTGVISITPSAQISGIRPNSTSHFSLTLAGRIGQDGSCTGTSYSDLHGSWTNVVVQATVKVTTRDYEAPVKLSNNKIILQSGQQCDLQPGSCIDSEYGYTFWNTLPKDYCNFNKYDVLYDGIAEVVTPDRHRGPTVYTVTSDDTIFALTQTSTTSICGFTLIKTEHPKLFIVEIAANGRFKPASAVPVNNLDIFTYVNSKFIYVEKHLRTQITQLYKDILNQKCTMEKQILQNALTLIHVAPEDVAFTITKKPGHMATSAGEAIHILQCIPVTCQVRKTAACYDELPVTYQNASYFLTPKSRILTTIGTSRECNPILPTLYKLHGSWYRMMPNPVETIAPQTLKPLTKPQWKYIDPKNLANGGIYTAEDLTKLRNHIMFPIEKPSIINSLAQGATGRQFSSDAIQLTNLLDESSLKKIAESTGKHLWSKFISFGSFTAGIIGIYTLFKIIKLIINAILNGIALHAAYGWSIHLLGAVWSTLAHFCIYLKQRKEASTTGVETVPQIEEPSHKDTQTVQTPHEPTHSATDTDIRHPCYRATESHHDGVLRFAFLDGGR